VLEPLCGGAAKTVHAATRAVPTRVARISTKARRRFMVFDSGQNSCPSLSYFSLENSRPLAASDAKLCRGENLSRRTGGNRKACVLMGAVRLGPGCRIATRRERGEASKIIIVPRNCAGTSHAFATHDENERRTEVYAGVLYGPPIVNSIHPDLES
jgi:hypothetical protein